MAHWHRSHLRASTEQLLAAYESGEDTYSQLWARRHYNSPDANPLCYYVTWIGLAARYGHPEAQKIIQGRVFFKYASIIKEKITQKDGSSLVGNMASEGTTPRRLTDLIGSLCDLTSGSGDKGTPIVYIQGYFDNYTTE